MGPWSSVRLSLCLLGSLWPSVCLSLAPPVACPCGATPRTADLLTGGAVRREGRGRSPGRRWPLGPCRPPEHWACPWRFYIKQRCLSPALCRRRRRVPTRSVPPAEPHRASAARQVPRLLPVPRGRAREGGAAGAIGTAGRERPRPPAGPATRPAPTYPRGEPARLPLDRLSARSPSPAGAHTCPGEGRARGQEPRVWGKKSLRLLGVGVGQLGTPPGRDERGPVVATSPSSQS